MPTAIIPVCAILLQLVSLHKVDFHSVSRIIIKGTLLAPKPNPIFKKRDSLISFSIYQLFFHPVTWMSETLNNVKTMFPIIVYRILRPGCH